MAIVDDEGRSVRDLCLFFRAGAAVQSPERNHLMAARSGTRLRPLTEKVPKP